MISKSKKTLFLIQIILVGVISFINTAYADSNIELSLSSDKTEISEGEDTKITLTIKTSGQNNMQNVSPIQIDGFENFRIIQSFSSNSISIVNGNSQGINTEEKVIVPISKGNFIIGPATMNYTDSATGQTIDIKSNSIEITVNEKVITKNELAQEQNENDSTITANVLSAGNKSSKTLENIISILVAFLTIGLIYFYFWYKKQQEAEIIEKRQVKDEIVLPSIDDDDFFEKITHTIRDHLKYKIGLEDIGATTSEIIKHLKNKKYYHANEIEEILKELDKSKFAKSSIDKSNILNKTKKIIN